MATPPDPARAPPGLLGEMRARYLVTKSVADLREESAQSGLRKSLGALDLTALGIGALVGAGIFVTLGQASQLAGPGVAVSLLVAALASVLAALAYAELAAMIPVGGSAYTYAYASMGELVAWLIAWNLVLEYAIGNMAVASGFSDNVENLLVAAGVALDPRWLAAPPVGVFDVPAFAISVLVTGLLVIGVRESAKANLVLVAVKLAALLVFILVVLPYASGANLTPFLPFGAGGAMAGAAIIFFAFIGFDAVSTAAEETRDPQRALPIGILVSLAVTTVLYVTVALTMTGAVPWQRLGVGDPLAETLAILGETRWSLLMSAAAVLATTSVILVFQLGATRIAMALARDGLIPAGLARVHPRLRTPWIATLVLGAFVGVFAALVPLGVLVELTNIGTLAAFVVVCLGVVILRRTQPDAPRPFRCPGVPWVPLAGALVCLALIAALPLLTIFRFVAWIGVGLMIYAAYGARRSAMRRHEAAEFGRA